MSDAERQRLNSDGARWKRWGPYVSDRAWGTVREDYSPHGEAWEHFSHDQARSRAVIAPGPKSRHRSHGEAAQPVGGQPLPARRRLEGPAHLPSETDVDHGDAVSPTART
jgi:hypothetical protein